ncbi:hypothetical protein NC652_020652 [Populus alba x Populus x berolinensis]|nr:hypothetical protein NC652_020652 [Populus alba x Populus x berolinensis]
MGLWKDKGLVCGGRWILAFKRRSFDSGDGTHPFLLGSPMSLGVLDFMAKTRPSPFKAELIDVEATRYLKTTCNRPVASRKKSSKGFLTFNASYTMFNQILRTAVFVSQFESKIIRKWSIPPGTRLSAAPPAICFKVQRITSLSNHYRISVTGGLDAFSRRQPPCVPDSPHEKLNTTNGQGNDWKPFYIQMALLG